MAGVHVKRDDMVAVIAGADKGKRGRILEVDRARNRVVVEGVNVRQTTVRPTRDNPRGGITEQAFPIHASNVMSAEEYDRRRGNADGGEEQDKDTD